MCDQNSVMVVPMNAQGVIRGFEFDVSAEAFDVEFGGSLMEVLNRCGGDGGVFEAELPKSLFEGWDDLGRPCLVNVELVYDALGRKIPVADWFVFGASREDFIKRDPGQSLDDLVVRISKQIASLAKDEVLSFADLLRIRWLSARIEWIASGEAMAWNSAQLDGDEVE